MLPDDVTIHDIRRTVAGEGGEEIERILHSESHRPGGDSRRDRRPFLVRPARPGAIELASLIRLFDAFLTRLAASGNSSSTRARKFPEGAADDHHVVHLLLIAPEQDREVQGHPLVDCLSFAKSAWSPRTVFINARS